MKKYITIAIDGTSGSGKSTIAKLLAKKLNYAYMNTGAMYRALGMFALDNNKNPADILDAKWVSENANLSLKFDGVNQTTLINNIDYTIKIKEHISSIVSSQISQFLCIRESIVDLQRKTGNNCNLVCEGRDIGSVVFPNAEYKFFFEVSAEIRAERRLIDLRKNGDDISYEKLVQDIKDRDYRDMTRKISPLKNTDDYITVDCSKSIDEILNFIMSNIKGE